MLSFTINDDGVSNTREGDNAEIIKFNKRTTRPEGAFQKPIGKVISFKFENSGKLNINYSFPCPFNFIIFPR